MILTITLGDQIRSLNGKSALCSDNCGMMHTVYIPWGPILISARRKGAKLERSGHLILDRYPA